MFSVVYDDLMTRVHSHCFEVRECRWVIAQNLLLLCTLRLQSNITQLVNMPAHWYSMPVNLLPLCLYLNALLCSLIMLTKRNQMIHTRDSFCSIFSIMASSQVSHSSQPLDGLNQLASNIALHIIFLFLYRQRLLYAFWCPI